MPPREKELQEAGGSHSCPIPISPGARAVCTRVRYPPLTAGSTLSFCKVGASSCSCGAPSKLSITFHKESPSWRATLETSQALVCMAGRTATSISPLAQCSVCMPWGTKHSCFLFFFLFKTRLLRCTRWKTAGIAARDTADEHRCAMQSLQL